MTKKLTVEISSVPDREKLVAEIWNGDVMVAEILQETSELEVELYTPPKESPRLSYNAFMNALKEGKAKLLASERSMGKFTLS